MAHMESLDTYTFDLRRGLRDAARVGLGQLEEMIGEIGYGWLDGHMEGILERTSRGPITELMKTPSRTQTVKKTRAVTTAMKDRSDKLQAINLHLGSPLSKVRASPSRAPLSPLQPRSVNASSILSPTSMKGNPPSKAVSSAPGTPSRAAKNAKAKKGKNDENASTCHSQNQSNGLFSPRGRAVAQPMGIASPIPKKVANSNNDKSSAANSPVPKKQKTPMKSDAMEIDAVPIPTSQQASSSTSGSKGAAEGDTTLGNGSTDEGNTTIKVPVPEDKSAAASVTFASETTATKIVEVETTEKPQGSATAIGATAKNGPMRQVRSSWLTKALGTGSVPITDHSDNMRKSFAAPPRQEPIDFSNLRKSLAPAGTLVSAAAANNAVASSSNTGTKRPSDGADEEDRRPEKFQKAEVQPIKLTHESKTAQPRSTSTNTQTPAPAPVSRPSSAAQEVHQSSAVSTAQTLEQTRADRHRSDIHKVTRALDELRERAAAKEAHKQKAALNASTGPRSTLSTGDRHTTTPGPAAAGGFLKGLGNLGMGLGRSLGLAGTAKSAEEEALRLQAELEEDRRAEDEARMELDRLMEELKGDTAEPNEGKETTQAGDIATEKADQMEVDQVEDERDVRATTAEIQDEEMIAVELDEPVVQLQHKEHRPTQPIQLFQRTSVPRPPTPPPVQPDEANVQLVKHTPVKSSRDIDVFESTTPAMSPPRRIFNMPTIAVQSAAPVLAPVVPALPFIQPEPKKQAELPKKQAPVVLQNEVEQAKPVPITVDDEEVDELDEDDVDLPELPEPVEEDDDKTDDEEDDEREDAKEMPAKKMFKSDNQIKATMSAASSSNSLSSLAQSTTSLSQSGMFGHASTIAGKTLGFKPAPGHVKSLQLAAAAAKKEQAATDKKAAIREQLEQRRAEAAKKKQEEERAKVEEDKKIRAAELEEKKRIRLELERKRKERDEKVALANREKAIKEEAEKAALKAKIEEETKKRKLAQAALLKKSAGVAAATSSSTLTTAQPKGKDPLRTIKPVYPLPTSAPTAAPKLGPTVFRTAETSAATGSSTITLVQPKAGLGPPSRPSSQLPLQHQGYQPQQFQTAKPFPASQAVLQQSRVHLQSQLDEKALETQSEDIVLPDIASEYSDSDDSDRSPDFKRPQWAESPELRQALQAQSTRNPDELFGPIKPLNMEELFKTRTNKFRARTSSANWNGGDRLTKAEEVEYARRMGFKPILGPSGLGGGSAL